MNLPNTIKCEVKLTTASRVQIPARELDALRVGDSDTVGLLAVLFWCGDRNLDGSWIVIDASRIRDRQAESFFVTKTILLRESQTCDGLGDLRRHITEHWPAFLYAFKEEALKGHTALVEELARRHRDGLVAERLPEHPILAVEHRATVKEIIDVHGESDAGRVMQDLFAYLLAFAGYRDVTNNAVGVPDFVLSDLIGTAGRAETVVVELTLDQAKRLLDLCRSAGEDELAGAVSRCTHV
ncbi:hypothetical protein [Sorangium sp. So ce1151]|uniref:hypothetical protein n=1 Tax=Sorangium sp. So ce1151 TaxID=3133332 RepID=UPI003F63A666